MEGMLLSRLMSLFRRSTDRSTDRASIGVYGEREAERLLKSQGFKVLARNWRKGRDEIDLVCMDEGILVFVETRTRVTGALVGGYDSIGERKKKALLRVCRAYVYELKGAAPRVRFDVVEVEHEEGRILESRHFENVPLFSKALSRGNEN